MSKVRFISVDDPLASNPELAHSAARLLARAEYLGVLPTGLPAHASLDIAVVNQVLASLADAGVAVSAYRELTEASANDYLELLRTTLKQTDHSPMPRTEWGPVRSTLGDDLLADLLGISASSIRRYATGERKTPDHVAGRLHFVALLLAELAGGYNEYGIRRWFARPRVKLDGQRPKDLMGSEFDVDGAAAEGLMALATGMSAGGAS